LNPLELRKIIIVGYEFDAPAGAPLLDADGLPVAAHQHPIRMRVTFWIPQRLPLKRRPVGTLDEYLRSVVAARPGATIALQRPASTLAAYMREHGLDHHLMGLREKPAGYTLVADARPFELQALRDGAIEEQIQDFTFPRQPSLDELRAHLMPHWEQRTLASLGYLPSRPPQDHDPKPLLQFASST